jgi:hypothetical protein
MLQQLLPGLDSGYGTYTSRRYIRQLDSCLILPVCYDCRMRVHHVAYPGTAGSQRLQQQIRLPCMPEAGSSAAVASADDPQPFHRVVLTRQSSLSLCCAAVTAAHCLSFTPAGNTQLACRY